MLRNDSRLEMSHEQHSDTDRRIVSSAGRRRWLLLEQKVVRSRSLSPVRRTMGWGAWRWRRAGDGVVRWTG
jgi:hypothetical protein